MEDLSVKAVTKLVPDGPGLRYWRDLDHHDRANDERVTAFFDDLYGITSSPRGTNPMRAHGSRSVASPMHGRADREAGMGSRTARPPSHTSVAVSSTASTHRSAPDTQPSPGCSARAVSSKERTA